MDEQMPGIHAVNKAIRAVLLQVDFLSDCGLDLCLAVTSHKRVQLWASSSWRDDLKDAIRKVANYQADLEEHNLNLDMFVEMKSQTNHRTNHVNQATETDTSAAPVRPSHDAVPKEPTGGSYVIDENIKIEPTDAERVFSSQTEYRNYMEEDADSIMPSHGFSSNHQTDESYIIEEESVETKPGQMFNKDENSGCTEEGDLGNHFNLLRTDPALEAVESREYMSAVSSSQPEAFTHEQPCKSTLTRADADTPEETLSTNLFDIALPSNSLHSPISKRTRRTHKSERCDYPSARESAIDSHMRTLTFETFSCQQCNYTSNFKNSLLTHMKKHTSETFNCKDCDYKSASKYLLVLHTRKHTGETVNCEHCEYKSTSKYRLQAHMRKHTGETFNCQHCDYKATIERDLRRHVRMHTGETFNCQQCDYRSNFKNSLLAHMRKHTGETFNCDQCNYKTIFKTCLVAHMKKHANETFDFPRRSFKSTPTSHLPPHMRRNTDAPPASVSPSHNLDEQTIKATPAHVGDVFNQNPNTKFIEEGELENHFNLLRPDPVGLLETVESRKHMSVISTSLPKARAHEQPCRSTITRPDANTPEETLSSNLFNIASALPSTSLSSQIIKHKRWIHKCELCEYTSTRKSALLSHMRMHTGETFNCKQCSYKSNFKNNLLAHMRKHTGETFNCQHCDYKSTIQRDLRRHMRMHTGETFNCDQCDYKSNFKNGLVAHMRKHTNETFDNPRHNFKPTRTRHLLSHMRRHTDTSPISQTRDGALGEQAAGSYVKIQDCIKSEPANVGHISFNQAEYRSYRDKEVAPASITSSNDPGKQSIVATPADVGVMFNQDKTPGIGKKVA